MPGKRPVPHSTSGLAGAALLGGAGARDGREQEGDPAHKSGPGMVSAPPSPGGERAETGTRGVRSCGGGEPRSGGVRLRQTGAVPGPGDGCGTAPEGHANESRGVAADFCAGRRGSGGSSLGAACHLRSAAEPSCRPITATPDPCLLLPHSENTHNSPPPCRRTPGRRARRGRGEIDDERGGVEEGVPEECGAQAAATTSAIAVTVSERCSRLGSLVSRVSGMLPDAAGRLLGRLPGVPGVAGGETMTAHWSGQVASLIRRSQMLDAVRSSQMFSLVAESYAFSLVKDSHAFAVVCGFPLIHRLQLELTRPPRLEETETTAMEREEEKGEEEGEAHNPSSPNPEVDSLPTQSGGGGDGLPHNSSSAEGESGLCGARELGFQTLEIVNIQVRQEEEEAKWSMRAKSRKSRATIVMAVDQEPPTAAAQSSIITLEPAEDEVTARCAEGAQMIHQSLLQFPDVFTELQSMPLPRLTASLRPLVPDAALGPRSTVALYWLEVATRGHPRPCPALVALLEAGLYTLTCEAGALAVSHRLPLHRLREIHVGLAGQSLRLTGGGGGLVEEEVEEEEAALDLHTHSWRLTQDVCRGLLGALCPGDGRASLHPLLRGDLAAISLDWHASVPDLLLDDLTLRVTCQFQKALADLVYFLHANTPPPEEEGGGHCRSVAELRVLLYTSVRVSTRPAGRAEPLARLLLTDTHLGLVQEELVFRPVPPSLPHHHHHHHHRSQFLDLWLRPRADVRCLLLPCSTAVEVVLARAARAEPPRAPLTVRLPEASKSSPRAEVWKLTFSCAMEAACLINHLSDV